MNTPNRFWKHIKKCFSTKEVKGSNSIVLNIDGNVTSDTKKIANGFSKFFAKIGKYLQQKLISLSNSTWKHHDHSFWGGTVLILETVFLNFRKRTLVKLKISKAFCRSKAQGYDEIPMSLLIDGVDIIAKPVSVLINRCLDNSLFPTAEKRAMIIPIYKAGSKTHLDNYRPISILAVLSKVFERVVQQQVYDYLEQNKLLSQSQFGFRKGSSTQHAVTLLSDAIKQAMDTGMLTGTVFVDLSKAFDTVDHARLLSKLPIYGILNRELKWFESYLFNRNHFVSFHGAPSEVCSISCGVPQGSILGPVLFVLLINDLEFQLKYRQIILYADDAVIYFADKDISIIQERLNTDLECISNWFSDNNLIVNLKKSKTECVLFGTHKKTAQSENFVIRMNGTLWWPTAAF